MPRPKRLKFWILDSMTKKVGIGPGLDGKSVLYLGEMQTLNRKLGHDLELLTHIMTSFYTKEYI